MSEYNPQMKLVFNALTLCTPAAEFQRQLENYKASLQAKAATSFEMFVLYEMMSYINSGVAHYCTAEELGRCYTILQGAYERMITDSKPSQEGRLLCRAISSAEHIDT